MHRAGEAGLAVVNGPGVVTGLFVASAAGSPMESRDEVRVLLHRGIDGDRYATGAGTYSGASGSGRHVTLIAQEVLDAVRAELGIALAGVETRRNVLTEGISLNDLVGRRIAVGEVLLAGTRLAEPCAHLERLTRPGVRTALLRRGGLRAEVVVPGVIRVGDRIVEVTEPPAADGGDNRAWVQTPGLWSSPATG
jgi:MOSC domain-containing protein YiiM